MGGGERDQLVACIAARGPKPALGGRVRGETVGRYARACTVTGPSTDRGVDCAWTQVMEGGGVMTEADKHGGSSTPHPGTYVC